MGSQPTSLFLGYPFSAWFSQRNTKTEHQATIFGGLPKAREARPCASARQSIGGHRAGHPEGGAAEGLPPGSRTKAPNIFLCVFLVGALFVVVLMETKRKRTAFVGVPERKTLGGGQT